MDYYRYMKTRIEIEKQINKIEKKLKAYQDEYDRCSYAPRELDLQVAIGQLSRQLSSLKKLLK
jgi:hypothetical protein